MTPQPLTVLLVSNDRPTVRGLSKFLQAFGYRVDEAANRDQASAALTRETPNFLIFDHTPGALGLDEIMDDLKQPRAGIYTFLMAATLDSVLATEALHAGVDDFLAKPLVFGELLARLRAGARILEHRRRLERQDHTDSVTGLPSRMGFCRTLQAELCGSGNEPVSVACIAFDLDFFGRVSKTHGELQTQRVLKAIVETISERLQDSGSLACGGGDQFFALLTGATEAEGAEWAERLRGALAGEAFRLGENTLQVTASFGVADSNGTQVDQRELVERALEAQQLAKESGRDCVALYSQLHDQARSWASLATPGKLFETTVARDVMIPCVVTLRRDELVGHAKSEFRRPIASAIPVVDGVGRFVGYVTEDTIAEAPDDQKRIRDLAIADAPCVDEETNFATLIEFFTQDPRSLIFIVGDGHPVGLVTRDSLTSLSDPVDSSTFHADLPDVVSTEHLSVHDVAFSCPS